MEGEITSDLHLRVAVRLDELNPAALFLHQSISRGKRYGMSISGTSDNFNIIRDDQGKRVIRFNQVALREISATTSPSWVPSFGTVLARSVDGVEDDEPVNRETTTSMPDPVTTSTAEQPTADLADAGTNSDVERGRIAKASLTSIQAAFDNFFKQLQTEIGLQGATEAPAATPEAAPTPAAAPAPENTSVENSDTGVETVDLDGLTVTRSQVDEVKAWSAALVERAVQPLRDQIAEKDKEIADAKQQIADLQAMPGKQRPAPSIPVDRAEGPDLSKMSPAEKIRFGLTGQL